MRKLVNGSRKIILITIDCLRASSVGCISGGNLTPNIDRLAKESVIFTRAFANGPGTNQSFPAILTSTYFLMHGGLRLSPYYTTLAEVLKRNGFKTVAFNSNPFLSKFLNWDRGFVKFYDFMDETKSPSAAITRKSLASKAMKILTNKTKIGYSKKIQTLMKKIYYLFADYEVPYLEAEELNHHVIKWIIENKNDRFFLWMHYMNPHPPFIPPERYLSHFSTRKEAFIFNTRVDAERPSKEELKILRDLYSDEIRYTDDAIGELLVFLEENGILEDSLVVLLADHGHGFMEHNRYGHSYDILYNEVLHVPLIIYGLNYSAKVNFPVQLLDVPPTILHAMKIEKPKDFLGETLISKVENNEKSRSIFSESAKPDLINLRYDMSKKVISCICGEWKLIINELWDTAELYNLRRDFHEKNNLVGSERGLFKEFVSLIQEHLLSEKLPKLKLKSGSAEKEKIKERLKALGYI